MDLIIDTSTQRLLVILIKKNGFDLSIQKYVFINDVISNEILDFEDAYSRWNNSSIVMRSEMDNLLSLLDDAI